MGTFGVFVLRSLVTLLHESLLLVAEIVIVRDKEKSVLFDYKILRFLCAPCRCALRKNIHGQRIKEYIFFILNNVLML